MDAFEHTRITLSYVRQRTAEVILFYSGGKDSIVLLHMLSSVFARVHCVFMYFLPDLDQYKPFLAYVSQYPNTTLHQFPHWMTSQYLKHNFYCHPLPGTNIRVFKQADVEQKAREITGCQYIVFGHKKADSMNRRLMLQTYLLDSINENGQKVYPLSFWTKSHVKNYISIKQLIKPVEYGLQNSNGVDLSENVLVHLRKNFPSDLEKILNVFPLAGKILYEYDYRQQNAPASEI